MSLKNMTPNQRYWFLKCRAYAWLVFGGIAMLMGWQNVLVFTFWLSVLANYLTDLGAAEAAHARKAVQDEKEEASCP